MAPDDRPSPEARGHPLRAHASSDDRSTRALGRGLEDVSHLFLLGAPEGRGRAHVDESAAEPSAPGRPATRAGLGVLRPGACVTKDQLTATLMECREALEPGLRPLATGVACSPYGEIDLLALDGSNQLTVIDIETTVDDGLLVRGLAHAEWMARNESTLRRLGQASVAHPADQPRLILVAPGFSALLVAGVRRLTDVRVTCFKYHPVAIADRIAIFIEQVRSLEG